MKIIDKKDVGQDMARLRTEIEILTRVKHPNIINLKEIMEDDHTLFIITELYVLRDLCHPPLSLSRALSLALSLSL